ncbi:MAG: aminotransferase class V-fold PLP-dependent enzyme, partial [Acidimicrobiia bacterium]|nr:aminotransferase class V-fold PLP-dependent enzyme [Acidimicrobiia bacterium]
MRKPSSRRRFLQASGAAGLAVPSATAASRTSPNPYARLGVKTVINGVGTVTVLGGCIMPPEVVQAMSDASRHFIHLPDLQRKAGAHLASLIGVPAAMITDGAASAITVATTASMTFPNAKAVQQLPDTTGLKNEVILQKSHRSGYEAQMLLTGAKLIWVESKEQLESAISPRTAMMFFLNKADPDGQIKRGDWIKTAKQHNIVSFNDAAADVPPVSRLKEYVQEGFDLVTFSGGKGLLGPQGSGLLLGRGDLMEVGQAAISPNGGIGRGMKVGKEEIMGLIAAVERYLDFDHAAERRLLDRRADTILGALRGVKGILAKIDVPEIANRVPHIMLDWKDPAQSPTPKQIHQA